MALLTRVLEPAPRRSTHAVRDKHFERKHGPRAYYGQRLSRGRGRHRRRRDRAAGGVRAARRALVVMDANTREAAGDARARRCGDGVARSLVFDERSGWTPGLSEVARVRRALRERRGCPSRSARA